MDSLILRMFNKKILSAVYIMAESIFQNEASIMSQKYWYFSSKKTLKLQG